MFLTFTVEKQNRTEYVDLKTRTESIATFTIRLKTFMM